MNNRMAKTENINAMISSYERIEGKYSFKNFLQCANIKSGTYACIGDLLKRSYQAITVSLEKNQIEELNKIREGNSNRVNLECADSITDKMTISKLEEIFGELCQQKDENGKRLWLTEEENLVKFWGKDNVEQLNNYDYISDFLAEYKGTKKNDIRLSFNQRLEDFTDDDVRKSISTFFDLIKHNQEVVDYIDELLSVIGSKGHISTKSVDKLLNSEKTPRFIAKSVVSTVEPESFNKIENIRYNYNEIRQISNQDNANYADILNKVINSLLNEGSKRCHFWSNILKFLNILRLLRNALGHYKKDLVEEGEQLPVACFILHSYVGTFLAITKNMQNQKALLPYDERQKTLTVYYKQDLNKENFRDDKGGELSIEEEEEILKNLPKPRLFREEEVEPFDVSNGCAKYPIYPMESDDQHYTIRWREGDSAVEAKVPNDKLWKSASSEPVAILNGRKYYFFTDLSNVYAELDPYIQNAQKKDVETLTELIKSLNGIVSNLKSSTDTNAKIVNGLKASVEKIQDKLDEIHKELKKGNKQRNFIIVILVFMAAIILILFVFNLNDRFSFFSSNDDPKTIIEKGDQYLKDGDSEKAGMTYKKAIKAYEDILLKDSMDVDANIGLAMMLMRGKGIYDLAEAKRCAKRASEESTRAEGLYHYLLFLNKKYGDADHLVGNLRADGEKDEYTILTDALLEIYGCCDRERSAESVLRARTVLDSLCNFNQDAVLDRAGIVKYGIEKEDCEDDFYIWPDPIFAESDLSVIANDSLNPVAMVMLSEFYGQLGEIKDCLEWGVSAYECGMKAYAPSLAIQMLQNNIIDNPGKDFKSIFKKLERSARHDKSLTGECAKYMTRVHNYSINEMSAKDMLKSTDDFIDILKLSQDDNYAQFLEQLYRFRVTLCLEVGNLSRATSLAMKVDAFNDSIAVGQYLEGICCDRGWAGQPQDSILRDNLINSSAERGYPEAVYTRLKKAEPLRCYPIRINRKDPVYKFTTAERVFVSDIYRKFGDKGVFRNSFYRNDKQSAKPIFDLTFITPVTNNIKLESLPKEAIVDSFSQSSPFVMSGEEVIEVRDNFDYKDFQYVVGIHYDASIYAQISDSIWSKSPKLAVELADYWRDYYSPGPYYLPIQEQGSPYVEYCPKEYQVIWDVLARCYNYVELSNDTDCLVTVDLINKPIMEDYFAEIKIGIASALKHGNSEMAKHLITMWLTLSNNNEVDEAEKVRYEKFALPEYKNKGFQPYKKIDYPIYAY